MTLLMQNCRCEPNNLQGVSDELYHAVGDSRRTVEEDRTVVASRKTGWECWTTGVAEQASVEWNSVCAANGLPMERLEERMVWGEQRASGRKSIEKW